MCREPGLASTFEALHLASVTPVSEQVRAARERVLVVPEPDLAVIVVTGDDRASWLNGLVTCDVTKLELGAAQYGLAVTQKGRIITDLFIARRADSLLLVVPRRAEGDLTTVLERHLVMEDAEMAKADALHVWLAHGPKAKDIAGAFACDVTGLGGALVVAESFNEVGDGEVGDRDGWEALRLERGVPAFGVDFDDKTYPQEASLEKRAVSFEKGCYLGQEVVCMLELRGHVKRKLVPFVADARVERGAAVTDDAGVEIGKVSSAADSPTIGKPIGLAMIKLAFATTGAKLHVGNVAITVSDPA